MPSQWAALARVGQHSKRPERTPWQLALGRGTTYKSVTIDFNTGNSSDSIAILFNLFLLYLLFVWANFDGRRRPDIIRPCDSLHSVPAGGGSCDGCDSGSSANN